MPFGFPSESAFAFAGIPTNGLAAAGKQDLKIAADIGISNQKASRWRKRFLALGLAGLEKDAPRLGAHQRSRRPPCKRWFAKPRRKTR